MHERALDTAATELPAGSAPGFRDRRREQRSQCDPIPARVQIDSSVMLARVLDISRFGIRLEVACCLSVPSEATVYFNNIIAAGVVRYCRRNQDDSFDAGMQVQDVLTIA